MKRTALVSMILIVISLSIGGLFWMVEWQYTLPTPVPVGYRAVDIGQQIELHDSLPQNSKPVFIHFFNPACPCSRFNVPHFKSLVKQFGDRVNFMIVPMLDETFSSRDVERYFRLPVPLYMDSTLAKKCGVYSTPQAVIIGGNRQLLYRGNYNRSRYCTSKDTEYARITLEKILLNDSLPSFDLLAVKAYGCKLPLCTNRSN